MPSPTPTAEEIETVQEITGLLSYAETEGLVNAVNDAQWAKIQADIELWNDDVRDDDLEIKNGLLGSNSSADANRLRLTNRVRRKLGLAELDSTSGGGYQSGTVPMAMEW